jgi:hypothetical protein
MGLRLRFLIAASVSLLLAGNVSAIKWPVQADSAIHHLGNSYGEYQNYGGAPYFHPGIDILVPAGTPVYAIKSGYVKAVLTTSAELHWRVAIGDSAGAAPCDGWLYAHLDMNTIAVYEGEYVTEGQFLGNIVVWPIANFHHLHFVKIHNSGTTWDSDWTFIGNPLDELEHITDPDAPVFENVIGTQKFAFTHNETASYFPQGATLSGDVDIICMTYDYINHYSWQLAPYKLEYKIDGDSAIPWTTSFTFTGLLDYANNVDVVYRNDAVCDSRGDYDYRWYYFNLTNTDGSGTISAANRPRSWQTAYFHNGDYQISARASDRAGNVSTTAMSVHVANFFALNGAVSYSDGNPDLRGARVTVSSTGAADTSDISGSYALASVPGGTQPITVTRPGYVMADTVIMMNQNHQWQVTLNPVVFSRGDANYDGKVNVGDIVYIINFVFKGSSAPIPYFAGDTNSDSKINVGDAVYLINFIFKSGPSPFAAR